jgi:oligopeptide/dipeptide ABC transporter ATP-binding protein
MNDWKIILEIEDLKTYFYAREGLAKAVDGVAFNIRRGEILGVVGESGCGKSITALSTLRLIPHPGRIVGGSILLNNENLLALSKARMKKIRGDRISMIFQEPMVSLNPAYTIENQLVEALRTHRKISRAEARNRAVEMLASVEIPSPEKRIKDYPHQLSGGMRQRAMIAEALLLKPDVLLADEPTTALDVTIQAQVLDIMHRLTQERDTAIMMITHNIGIVEDHAHRMVVMYAGRVAEKGLTKRVLSQPAHPYTRGLLRSIPKPRGHDRGNGRRLFEMTGLVPSLFDLPEGCLFHPRCQQRREVCTKMDPPWTRIDDDHQVRCWQWAE